MTKEYYQIKDECREELLKYLAEAVSLLPEADNPRILDIGCGTGIPTIWLAEKYGGTITAIDIDKDALNWLQKKIINKNLENQITVINISFNDLKEHHRFFDIILAEGFLNVIGFEQGFVKLVDILKGGGYFVIHDEYKDHEKKCDYIRKNNCELVGTVFLDESVWWNDYYRQLEIGIESVDVKQNNDLFKAELNELELYKKDPSLFRSIYYVVIKQ
jgi:cyclopropane fatty-acyl-phospholipid synthase-like methyltransferase